MSTSHCRQPPSRVARPSGRVAAVACLFLMLAAGLPIANAGLFARARAPRGTHAFSVLSSERPRVLMMDTGVRMVRVTLRNDGSTAWDPEAGFALSYHWRTPFDRLVQRDGARSPLPTRVLPGQTVALDAEIDLPPASGLYVLEWDMVQEHVTWFSERDPASVSRSLVLVLPAAPSMAAALPLFPAIVAGLGVLFLVRLARKGTGPSGSWAWTAILVCLPAWDLLWLAPSLFFKQVGLLSAAGVQVTSGALYASALTSAAPAALLFALFRPSRRGWAAWAVAAFGSLVLLGDAVYFRYFGDVLSVAAVRGAPQAGYLTSSVRSLLRPQDAWLALDLLVALPLVLRLRWARFEPPSWQVRAVVPAGLAATLLLAVPSPLSSGLWKTPGDGIFRHLNIVEELGFFGYHCDDAARYLETSLLRPTLTRAQIREAGDWFAARAPQRAGAGPYFGVARGRNVLFVLAESLQGFVVGLSVNGHEITPNLNRLRSESLWSARVVDQAGEGRTSDAEMTNAASLLPLPHGAAAFLSAGDPFVAVPDLLRARGYDTASAVAFDGSFWNRRVMHPAYGISRTFFGGDFQPGERVGWGLNDRSFVQQMRPRLRSLRPPFFAWLITLSLHHPFDSFPDSLRALDLGPWNGTRFGNYLHAMHLFDEALGDLLDGLRQDGLLDQTLLVVEGDHEAGVDWSDVARAVRLEADTLGWYLADRVPLFIRVPGQDGPRGQIPIIAGQADIPPTLLALLGVDPAPLPFIGRNLLGAPRDEPVIRRYGDWVDSKHLYLSGQGYTSERACFDLAARRAVPLAACAAGQAEAERELRVSTRVLTFGLQRSLMKAAARQ